MIAIDTNIFIYWLERNPDFYEKSAAIIKNIYSEVEPSSCSVLVLSELYNGSAKAIEAVSNLPGLFIVDVTKDIAELAGKLRRTQNLKVIDAVHLASAIHSKADKFVTNDQQLATLAIPNLEVQLLTTF